MRRATALLVFFALLLTACDRDERPAPASEVIDAPVAGSAQAPRIDPQTGLRMTGDWEVVRANCVGCHSGKLITQQRGTAQQWLTMIRWMQAKQNLWQFDPATEEKIIGYLAANYPPGKSQRRAALSPDLMPPNPYKR